MHYIIAIRFRRGGYGHAGIEMFKTSDAEGTGEKTWSPAELLAWTKRGGQLRVKDSDPARELVVRALNGTPPVLRAFDVTSPTDVILSLPRF